MLRLTAHFIRLTITAFTLKENISLLQSRTQATSFCYPHEDMKAHRKECPHEMVQCDYHNVGWEERMMHKRKR